MTLKALVVLPLCLSLGCVAAPREVETTIALGPQKVEIDVRLKDVRTGLADDLTQLRVFHEFADWDPEWIKELPWAPTPTHFEYSGDGGRLDLSMRGSMSRAEFDKCARAAFDAGVCIDFPLELGKSGYAVRPEILAMKSLVIDPKQKTSWAADGGRISYRVGLSGTEEKFITDGPSLARGFAIFQTSPARAVETVQKIDASEEVLLHGTVAAWVKELAALEACTQLPWCRLQQEAARREQARLVYGYLRPRPEAGAGIKAPPDRHIGFLGASFGALLPKDPLPLIDDLRLRIKYDVLLDGFASSGWLSADPSQWAGVCRPDTMKKATVKDFCARLGVRTKK